MANLKSRDTGSAALGTTTIISIVSGIGVILICAFAVLTFRVVQARRTQEAFRRPGGKRREDHAGSEGSKEGVCTKTACCFEAQHCSTIQQNFVRMGRVNIRGDLQIDRVDDRPCALRACVTHRGHKTEQPPLMTVLNASSIRSWSSDEEDQGFDTLYRHRRSEALSSSTHTGQLPPQRKSAILRKRTFFVPVVASGSSGFSRR
jgi:hypothetical protein